MSNDRRNQALKTIALLFFLCTLTWNLGAVRFPASSLHDPAPTTALPIKTESKAATETPALAALPTETLSFPDLPPTETPIQTSESAETDRKSLPLPAIFAAGPYAPGELVIRFKASTSPSRIESCFQGADVRVRSAIEELKTYVLWDDSNQLAGTFYQVQDCAGALYVEPNYLLGAVDTVPNDPGWSVQYGLTNIRAPQGWDLSTGSASVTIAIVDSGVDGAHPDLSGKLVGGYDFVNNDSDPQDDYGHGTHVAGIAAASSNNAAGISGVSWGARLLPIKVLDAKGGGTYANTAAGVVWAADHGAQVINLSLGGIAASAILEDAINYAYSKGAVIVAAAGNTGSNFVLYPARYPHVIAVARTNTTNNWDGSNFGPEIDLSAPGSLIYSTVIGGYDYKSGSSMSTGFVSGLAAILMGIPGNTSPDAIESEMESSALDLEFAGWDDYTGAGLIQMDKAIQFALQINPTPTRLLNEVPTARDYGSGQVPLSSSTITLSTFSPTPATQEALPTLTPAPTGASTPNKTIHSTPVVSTQEQSEVQAQGASQRNNYILPCTGIVLILLGSLLLLAFRRKK